MDSNTRQGLLEAAALIEERAAAYWERTRGRRRGESRDAPRLRREALVVARELDALTQQCRARAEEEAE